MAADVAAPRVVGVMLVDAGKLQRVHVARPGEVLVLVAAERDGGAGLHQSLVLAAMLAVLPAILVVSERGDRGAAGTRRRKGFEREPRARLCGRLPFAKNNGLAVAE